MAKHCGAKTRAGGQCKAPAMKNGRCRVHGGASTGNPSAKGNQNAVKHGIYGDLLRPDEQAVAADVQSATGKVENELLIARMQLRRALAAQARADALPNGMEVFETVDREGAGEYQARNEVKKKLRDYPQIIDRLLARIESLERTRGELIRDKAPDALEGFTFTVKRARKDAA